MAETDDLAAAMVLMESVQESIVAVVDDRQEPRLIGNVRYRDFIRAYDRALMRARAEEHGDN